MVNNIAFQAISQKICFKMSLVQLNFDFFAKKILVTSRFTLKRIKIKKKKNVHNTLAISYG